MLDEAHTIKSSKSQISMAAAALTADRRWCLTGTPIQVNNILSYNVLVHGYCPAFLFYKAWSPIFVDASNLKLGSLYFIYYRSCLLLISSVRGRTTWRIYTVFFGF